MSLLREPLTLLLDLSKGCYSDLLDDIALLLQANSGEARVKAGALLEHEGGLSFVETTPFEEGFGRRRKRSSKERDLASTRAMILHVLEQGGLIYTVPNFEISMLAWNGSECISISDVGDQLVSEIMELAKKSGMLILALRWQPHDSILALNLWRRLILTRVITHGEILRSYEEYPLDEIYDESKMRWRPSRPPWAPATGYFFSYDEDIYPDDSHDTLVMPSDLVETQSPSPIRSPIQRALANVGHAPVLRISGQDVPEANAVFRTPEPHLQFPDVAAVERKIREYCLNQSHPCRKWTGFYRHGWDGSHPLHNIQLAALLSSALFSSFEPIEPRVTADGALQFGTKLAVPSLASGYMQVEASWVAKQGKPLELATAFVVGNQGEPLDPTFPFVPGSQLSWESIVHESLEFGREAPQDNSRAFAGVFISRNGEGNKLSKELVKAGKAHGGFKRAKLGGRCVIAHFGGTQGWVQASRASAFTQVLLGLNGVLSLQETLVD